MTSLPFVAGAANNNTLLRVVVVRKRKKSVSKLSGPLKAQKQVVDRLLEHDQVANH